MQLGTRIAERLTVLEISQSELARRASVPQTTVNSIIRLNRRTSPHLFKIARALETTPEYLTGETDDPSPGAVMNIIGQAVAITDDDDALDGMVMINEVDIALGLGGAHLDGAAVVRQIPFPETWLRLFTDAPPDLLDFVEGRGDSMEPTVPDRSICLIDRSRTRLDEQDALWAVVYGGLGMIKRLRQMPDGTVKIISDNPSVPAETATDGDLYIFGRCRGVFKRT